MAPASEPSQRMGTMRSTRGMFAGEGGRNLAFTFCLVSTLFCLWGFCNGMIDVMDKHFQEELHLNLAQSAWVQVAHYLGYCCMAFPAGLLAQRFGYKGGIVIGLLVVALGGLWFLAAVRIDAFWAFLLGVFIIAVGLSSLETVANPYTAVLGDPRRSAVRINLAQSFNGVGWFFGPIAAGKYFYSVDAQGRSTSGSTLSVPYVAVAVVVLVLATVFYFAYVPDVQVPEKAEPKDEASGSKHSLWSQRHFAWGVAAQFLYVAAQAGIFSFFINYMTSQVGVSDKVAANLASLAFLVFLAGRASGAAMLRRVVAHRLLAWYGVANVIICLVVFAKLGWPSVAGVFLSYFFMSIMFPTIFDLGIHGLGARTKRGAAFLVMAIAGGAIVPKLMGYVADRTDLSRSFLVPMVCFAFVAYYGWAWPRLSGEGEAPS